MVVSPRSSSRSFPFGILMLLLLFFLLVILVACQGEPGLLGQPGAKGDPGVAGPQGPKGEQGSPGIAGLKGDTGLQGAQGLQGLLGAKGDAGATGTAAYILEPGYKITLNGVVVGADRKPVATFTIQDGKAQPRKLANLDSNPSFVIAYIKKDAASEITQYVNYNTSSVTGTPYVYNGKTVQPKLATWPTRPGTDSGGAFAEVSPGKYTYSFRNALPANYDTKATHSVGVYTSRGTREFVSNAVLDFVPDGSPVVTTRQLVNINNCNACHDQLAFHGGTRVEAKLCVLCHTSQNVDPETGNSVEMQVMIHRIHSGARLESVLSGTPYYIIGNRQSVFDYTKVGWPQDIRNCTTCHKDAPNADEYKTKPTIAACTSCHEKWDPVKGVNHDVSTEAECVTCHKADTGREFDNSVVGSHVIPAKSNQLAGAKFALLGATVKAGEKPSVDFQITNKAGQFLDPNTFNSLEIVIAHPTTDYAHRIGENVNSITTPPAAPFVRAGVLTDLGGGKWRYTFAVPLDATWKGSVGIGMGGYRNATIKGRLGANVTVRETDLNPVIYASVDGTPVEPRRSVVDRNNCNVCHLDLGNPAGISIHGGTRRNTEFCILCHNPNFTDVTRKAGTGKPLESIHFKYMIHSLHMGDERAVPALFGRAAATEEVFFPGNIKNCENCHKAGTNLLPLPKNLLPSTVTDAKGVVLNVRQPTTSACLACHASESAEAHAEINTSAKNIESCVTCHAENREFAVSKMHQ